MLENGRSIGEIAKAAMVVLPLLGGCDDPPENITNGEVYKKEHVKKGPILPAKPFTLRSTEITTEYCDFPVERIGNIPDSSVHSERYSISIRQCQTMEPRSPLKTVLECKTYTQDVTKGVYESTNVCEPFSFPE